MTKKIIETSYTMDIHGNIKYPEPEVKVKKPSTAVKDVSIDFLLRKGLTAIDKIIQASLVSSASGDPSRESVMNLKDCMGMLHELKKKEDELLETMTDEQIDEYLKKNK